MKEQSNTVETTIIFCSIYLFLWKRSWIVRSLLSDLMN